MQKNPYIILGVDENAELYAVHEAYNNLKLRYSQDRFLEGEEGRVATQKLAELENAYNDCLELMRNRVTVETKGSVFGDISELIKTEQLSKAQDELDKIEYRDAEWHYYQSIIYFKKNWTIESKNQLEICIALEPTNEKYKKALEKIKQALAQENPFEPQGNPQPNTNQQQQRAGYGQPNTNQRAGANACCDSCCAMMCCDSCCECCGGDLISCC